MGPVRGALCETSLDPCKVRTPCHRSKLKTRQFWTFMCMALSKYDKRFFGSNTPSMSVCQGQRRQSSSAPVPVQREQCQSNVSVVPVQDLTVSEEFVSPTLIFLQDVRSTEAVSEKIVSAVSTSESTTLDVCLLPCRSRLFK